MQKVKYLLTALLLVATFTFIQAQDAKRHLRDFSKLTVATFEVNGRCGSCQKRILNTARAKGIRSAYWNKEEQLLTVQYHEKLISLTTIQFMIAAVGHDTEKFKAPDEAYAKLPGCCHYSRKTESNLHF